MSTVNTAFGRLFTETVFVAKLDHLGKPIPGQFDRVPAIWNGMSQPVAERSYYPGDPMSAASRLLTQKTVAEFARAEAKRGKKQR